jgi:pimeloyl-ACP methyl ester carboxylesterase
MTEDAIDVPLADNEDVRIHYEVEGVGPPLVLQHGLTMSLRRWSMAGYVDALKHKYQLILIDARGHGQSDKPHDPAAYALGSRAKDVVAVLDDLAIRQAHYWGYSMGGLIGFGLAQHAPERLMTMIIGGMDAFERKMPPSSRVYGGDPDAYVQAILDRLRIDPATLPPAVREELLANDFKAIAASQQDRPSMVSLVQTMTMPCLLYSGEADPVFTKALETAKLIPNASFFSLPQLDHGAAFREASLVLPHVTEFLERHSGCERLAASPEPLRHSIRKASLRV